MANAAHPEKALGWIRAWRERVVESVARATERIARPPRFRGDEAAEIGRSFQHAAMRLAARAVAAGLGRWPEDGAFLLLADAARIRETGAVPDDLLDAFRAVDEQTRAANPWIPGQRWLDDAPAMPSDVWPPEIVGDLVRAVLSCRDATGGALGPCATEFPAREVSHLYEALLALADRPRTAADILLGGLKPATRKSTGTYYTPDRIVAHIVGQALAHARRDDPAGILSLRVLDPAMGTGAFLVEALATMDEWLADSEARHGEYSGDPAPPFSVSDEARGRWLVADRCLYGVDRDSTAVDVARFLLWVAIGDGGSLPPGAIAHLRTGNSLVGCRAEDLSALPGGERMVERAIRVRAALVAGEGRLADAGLLREHAQVLASCDLHTSFLFEGAHSSTEPKALFENARALAARHGFFHWDLAFPEVFCAADGMRRSDGGFDAIVGNPPYAVNVRPIRAALEKAGYLTLRGAGGRTSLNTAVIFIDRAHQLLRPAGVLGFIIPNSILRVGQYARVRELLLRHYRIHEIVDEGMPFDAANLEVVSFIASRGAPDPGHEVLIRDRRGPERISGRIAQRLFVERQMVALYLDDVVLAMEDRPRRLGEIVRNQRGVSVAPGNVMVLSANPSVGRWMLRGRNLMRYGLVHIPGDDRYLRARPANATDEMLASFDAEKLLIQNIGSRVVAALSRAGEGFLETVNILRPANGTAASLPALLVILNSRLVSYYLQRGLINRSPITVHLDGLYTDRFPIPDLDRAPDDRAIAREIAARLADKRLAKASYGDLLAALGDALTARGARWSDALAAANDQLLGVLGWGSPADAAEIMRRDLWLAGPERFRAELVSRDPSMSGWPVDTMRALAALHERTRAELTVAGTALGRYPFPYAGSLDELADRVVYAAFRLAADQVARVDAAMGS